MAPDTSAATDTSPLPEMEIIGCVCVCVCVCVLHMTDSCNKGPDTRTVAMFTSPLTPL